MARRRSEFPAGYARQVDEHPVVCVRTLNRRVERLREIEAGTVQLAPHETVDQHRRVIRQWIEACREVGVCKRCGERLVGASPVAQLARERGVGSTCWERLTADEQQQITDWVERQRRTRRPLEEPR